jgi:hypothetical protein
MQIILLLTLLIFGFNKDSILIRAGENSQEVEKFILESEQKGYKDWAEFLLASMPDVDLVDLKSDAFITYFDALKNNYNRVPWRNKIDDNLFNYYILPHRVSQEPLENFTAVYADTLFNLVKKTKNMRDAVFRINEWVYTKMIYEPTERWDQNALTTIKRGIGRCEEMSILFIKALRTVCIPARHTYTPWWSHTNSNHAWVEIWVNSKWHSLGGGELTDLDNAWFATPTKRAPIIKSVVYGKMSGGEEVIDRSEKDYTIINSTPNYSDVVELVIQVKKDSLPEESTSVSINVYNYSSLAPVGLKKTDNNGFVQWVVGKTDLFIYAYKDSQIGYQIWRPSDKNNDTVSINLSKTEIPDTSFWFYSRKIIGQNIKSRYKPNVKLLDKLRDRYFAKINIVDSTLKETLSKLDTNLIKIISDAKGNGRALLQFYLELPEMKRPIFLEYFKTLVPKDIVSIDTTGLSKELSAVQRAITLTDRTTSDTIIRDYIIAPRVLYEQLEKWRLFMQTIIDENLPLLQAPGFVVAPKEKVDSIFEWARKNIELKKEGGAFGPMMNPEDVYKAKRATDLERYVFITGVLRSVGIPARIKWSYDAVEYWDNRWIEKSFETKVEKGKLWVSLKFTENAKDITNKMEYYDDYSITRFKESPTRIDPEIDTINNTAIVTLDNQPSYLITGWRNGFGDTYVRIKKIAPMIDTANYTENVDIPEDIKHGDLIVREYKGLPGLDKYNIKSKDLEKGGVLIIVYDPTSESSISTLKNAKDAINNFNGNVYLFATGLIGVASESSQIGINKGDFYVIPEFIYGKWGVKDLPSIIYLKDGKCIFWVEGLNLHLSRLIPIFQK